MTYTQKISVLGIVLVMALAAVAPIAVRADNEGDFFGGYGGGDYYVPDYTNTYVPDYTNTYVPDYTNTYVPDYTNTYVPDYTNTFTPDYVYRDYCGCYQTATYQNGVAYSYTPYSYSTPSYSPSQPFTFSSPSHPSYPAPQPQRPVQQQQQQQQQQQGGQPINIVNTNTNVNTNVNTAPVTPVYQMPVQYPVQYVYPQQTYQRPYCTISISNYGGYNYGNYGNQLATLTWSSSYGTSAYISPNVGNVAPYGSMTVYPTYSTIYTMTVYGQGGTATCQTSNYNYVTPPSVSLSQIPYTGFDFGTFGNSIYWLSLIAFAVAGSYLLIYFRGGVLALAGAMIPVRSARPVARASKTETVHVATPVAKVSPVQIIDLPVSENSYGTTDRMVLARSKGNEAPRIVITRS